MRQARMILAAVLVANVCVAMVASAKGLLPGMVYRRGLTNEQIDGILEKHPDAQLRITAQDWRGLRYQLYRFHNMTNYVELIGSTQDCARVLLQLHDATETLTASNVALVRVAHEWQSASAEWQATANAWRDQYAGATNQYHQAVEDFRGSLKFAVDELNAATNRAAIAEARVARAEAAKAWLEEQRDKAALPTTKAIYQAIIDKLEGK